MTAFFNSKLQFIFRRRVFKSPSFSAQFCINGRLNCLHVIVFLKIGGYLKSYSFLCSGSFFYHSVQNQTTSLKVLSSKIVFVSLVSWRETVLSNDGLVKNSSWILTVTYFPTTAENCHLSIWWSVSEIYPFASPFQNQNHPLLQKVVLRDMKRNNKDISSFRDGVEMHVKSVWTEEIRFLWVQEL